MKKTFKGFAALLLAAGTFFACLSMVTKPNNGSAPLRDHDPVIIAKNNTLSKTPTEIENLVKGLNIDIRNSAYLILQEVKTNDSYTWGESTNEKIDYFVLYSIISPTNGDVAISNLATDDMNNCFGAYGDNGNCYEIMWHGGPTWKARVVDKILSSESLQNILYNWVKPELIRVVGSFNSAKKSYLKSTLDHMINYTANYNHKAEKDFYNICLVNDDLDSFTCAYRIKDKNNLVFDYNDIANPYRRLETWVYRRVEEGSMTASQINTWLKKLKNDLGC